MTTFYFVEPTDSLFVRGNLAFGDSGEHGAGVMPPPPSLFAGAFRSAILGRDADALARFTRDGASGDADLDSVVGTFDPEDGKIVRAGSFQITWLTLAGIPASRTESPNARQGHFPASGRGVVGNGDLEAVFPLTADLVNLESGFVHLTPEKTGVLVADARELPWVAVLRTRKQEKPPSAIYLRETGWRKHLGGELPDKGDGVETRHLHARDPRLGIGLNAKARTAEPGLIYTTEGHAFSPAESPFSATGFLVGIDGAEGVLPECGFLRLGGDGRGARYRQVDYRPPVSPLEAIARSGCFRLILATPGLFTAGWLPGQIKNEGDDYVLRADGCTARLICAAIPRREIISGWDLFRWRPKDALRAVPTGSVYWFDNQQGDPGKLAEWVAKGLHEGNTDKQRRSEGYNLASVGAWN